MYTELNSSCIYTVPATMGKNSQENDREKVKVIIGKMIENADLTVRPVISSFDSSQSRSVNIKRLDQFNVVMLEKCADFLGIPLADKDNFKLFTKPTLMERLYLDFKALLPAKCGECSEEYVIDREPNVAPFFSCFRCFQGSHDCDRNRTLHQTLSAMDTPTGFVWLCIECHGIIDPIEPRKQRARHVSASESLLENQSIDSSGDFSSIAHRNAMSSTQNLNQQVSFPNISPEQKSEETISSNSNSDVLCQNFLKWKCPHGISGKKKIHGTICPYVHPRVCNQYRLSGSSGKNGCQKGGNCSFSHPEICKPAVEKGSCLRRDCSKFHPRSTRKKNREGATKTKPTTGKAKQQSSKQNTGAAPKSSDFLELRSLVTGMAAKLEALEKKIDQSAPSQSYQSLAQPVGQMIYPAPPAPHMMNLGVPRLPHHQIPISHHSFN